MKSKLVTALLYLSTLALLHAQPIQVNAQKPFVPEGKPLEGLVITIDAGHGGFSHTGGYSGSARGVNSHAVEQDLNMLVTAELFQHLRDAGAQVYMTRLDDRKVTLGETGRAEELGARVDVAMKTHSHLFLALHHNSAGRAADGVVVMLYPTDSKGKEQPLENQFAAILKEEVQKTVHHGKDFNLLVSNHPLVAGCDIPSSIIEFGFLSNPDFDAWVSQKGSHRMEALGAYNGIVRMWKEHRTDLEALRKKLFGKALLEDAKKPRHIHLPPDQEYAKDVNDLVQSIWHEKRAPQTVAEAQNIIDGYKKMVLTDATFFYLNATVEKKSSRWSLTGSTNFPFLKKSAENILNKAGLKQIQNNIALLPSEKLGDQKYGVVQIPMALTWNKPEERTGVQTQLLFGEQVYLLDVNADTTYYLVHGGDGYIGWVRREAISLMDSTTFAAWQKSPKATFVHDYMCDELRFPTGGTLPIITTANNAVVLQLPRTYRATSQQFSIDSTLDLGNGLVTPSDVPFVIVPKNVVRLPSEISPGRTAALTALEYLTVPYVFGGKSKMGLDCSGLTGSAYASVGLILPRDAKQQILVGKLIATPWHLEDLEPGDLIFFCDELGKVVHTGVSLGGLRFIHASPPEVQVSSFDKTDPLYAEEWDKMFTFARRPLGD